jgi:hypothetical protein
MAAARGEEIEGRGWLGDLGFLSLVALLVSLFHTKSHMIRVKIFVM